MTRDRRLRPAAFAVASAGVMVSHWLAYLLHAPEAGSRSALLTRTGHAYQTVLGEVVAVLLTISLVTLFLGRAILAGGGPASARSLAARLAAVQAGAFVGMEVMERLAAGAGMDDLTSGGLLATGIGLNIVVALVGARALRSVLRLADRAAAVARSGAPVAPRRAVAGPVPPRTSEPPPPPSFRILPARAPPPAVPA